MVLHVFHIFQVGRVVSGLPSGTIEFTMLPARFAADSEIEWSDIVPNYSSYPEGNSIYKSYNNVQLES